MVKLRPMGHEERGWVIHSLTVPMASSFAWGKAEIGKIGGGGAPAESCNPPFSGVSAALPSLLADVREIRIKSGQKATSPPSPHSS